MAQSFGLYKSYSFTDKDPVIDKLRTLRERTGLTNAQISEKSGVAASTLYGWFDKKTRRPQHPTVMAVVRGMGFEYEIMDPRTRRPVKFSRSRKK